MRYYAIYRPYGVDAINRDGVQANVLHAFNSQGDRNEYLQVSDKSKIRHLLASSPTVKRLLRRPAEEWRKDEFVPGAESITFMDD